MRGVEAQVREAVGDELAGMWAANRRRKLAELESIYEDVEREIQDAGLTRAARNKNRNLLASFIHDMNEITGHFQFAPLCRWSLVPDVRSHNSWCGHGKEWGHPAAW